MMIFVTSDDPTSKDMRKLEDVVFVNEQVGLGSKFFDCVKMSAGDALQDRIIAEAGNATPRIVFMRRDYTVSSVLQRTGISGGKLLKAMKSAARTEYKTNFDKMVRAYRKMLDELDRFDSKRAYIADQKKRLAAKPNATKAKKIEREEKELAEGMEEWKKREDALKELKSKDDKPAEA